MSHRLKHGAINDYPESWEAYDTGKPGGHITPKDQVILAELLGLQEVHHQGVDIPASNKYWQEYLDRANGIPLSVIGEMYWD